MKSISSPSPLLARRGEEAHHFTCYLSLVSKIFLCPGADAIERLLDVLDRVGHAEAQIAFAEVAEGGPGQSGDASFVQQRVGQFLGWPSGLLDVRENVERAFR